MSPEPSFSVIVAAYNAEKYLSETLWSLRRQTFAESRPADFEVIVIDDGSTDATAEIARQFCVSDPRFSLVQTSNRGISPARNLAASRARGGWLAVCDADDTWHPEKLARQARAIARWPEASAGRLVALGTAGHLTNARGEVVQAADPGLFTLEDVARQRETGELITLINSSVVFRRDVFGEVGGYRAGYTPAEDTDLWMRLAERGVVINLPGRLTGYRQHAGNVSTARHEVMMLNARRTQENARRRRAGLPEDSLEAFRARLAARGELAEILRQLAWGRYIAASRNSWHNGRRARAVLYRLRSALIQPGQSLAWLLTYLRGRRWSAGHRAPPEPASLNPVPREPDRGSPDRGSPVPGNPVPSGPALSGSAPGGPASLAALSRP